MSKFYTAHITLPPHVSVPELTFDFDNEYHVTIVLVNDPKSLAVQLHAAARDIAERYEQNPS